MEHSHEAIIDPEEFELVQAEIKRRKGLGKEYSGSSIFSAKIVCACCGGFFGSKVWHSTSKYKRSIVTDTFDGKLWLLLVEKATVGTDGKLTFTLRNGMEIEV